MRIICCRCGKEYRLQDNLYEAEIANKPVLKCPHCGSLHLVDFTPTKKDHSRSKLSQLKLVTYYAAMGGSRICDSNRNDLSADDDIGVVKPAADDFIVAVNINSGGKNTAAAQYKLRWRDRGEVAGTYHFDGSDAAATDPDNAWTDETNTDDGSITTRAYCSTSGTSDTNEIFIQGTNAPSSGDTITDVRVRIYGYATDDGDDVKARVWKNGRLEALGTANNPLLAAGWGAWLILDVPAAGWDWATVQGLEVAIYGTIASSTNVYAYKVEIDVMKGGSAFADVGATGKIHYNADTVLVNGAAIAIGDRRCDSQGADTWQDGEEVEGTSLCDSIDLADEYETEIHFALDSSGAENGHKYEFELWDVTNGASKGTLGATVRIADEVDSYGHANWSENTQIYSGYRIGNAHAFTCSTACELDSAVFYACKIGAPTGNVYAKIYAETHTSGYGVDSKPTGSALATSDPLDISAFSANHRLKTFVFSGSNRISLSASTYYCVSIEFNGGDSSNKLEIKMDNTPAHSGNRSVTATGASWEAKSEDLIFGVYGVEAAVGDVTVTPDELLAKGTTPIGSIILGSTTAAPDEIISKAHTPVGSIVHGSLTLLPDELLAKALTIIGAVIEGGDVTLTPDEMLSAALAVAPTIILGSTTAIPDEIIAKGLTPIGDIIHGSLDLTLDEILSKSVTPLGSIIHGSITKTPDEILAKAHTPIGAVIQDSIIIIPDELLSAALTLIGNVIEGGGDLYLTPDEMLAKALCVEGIVILSSMTVSPDELLSRGLTPIGNIIHGSITKVPDEIIAKALTIAPVVIKGSIDLLPDYIKSAALTVEPNVIHGSLIFTPGEIRFKALTIIGQVIEGVILVDLELAPVVLIIGDTQTARLVIPDTLEARLKT